MLELQVTLHVPHFSVNDISVKLVDKALVIVAEHAEKSDQFGHVVSRRLQRRFLLPRAADADAIVATLSDQGLLTVTAPKKHVQQVPFISWKVHSFIIIFMISSIVY